MKRNIKGQFVKGNIFRHSEKTKRKIVQSHIGIGKGVSLSIEHRKAISEAMIRKGTQKDEKNPMWKGDKVKYMGLHNWVRRHLGTPKKCENCGLNNENKEYHWANKSGKYLRDLSDWIRLCVKCHKAYDIKRTK